MDGNNRWARQRGLLSIDGHKAGVERIREALSVCRDNEIEVLTVFAFSSENWQRPTKEVDALMGLFHLYLRKESKKLCREGVKLRVIGDRQRFGEKICKAIVDAEATANSGKFTLIIAADYGGKWDIVNAAKKLTTDVLNGKRELNSVDEDVFNKYICLSDFPPLDMLIRTGNECRISNFLLWQCAYSELFFSEKLWPDFHREDFESIIYEYHTRQRRFGLNGEQMAGNCFA
jgi:undecaprenyl diphosphate synthase